MDVSFSSPSHIELSEAHDKCNSLSIDFIELKKKLIKLLVYNLFEMKFNHRFSGNRKKSILRPKNINLTDINNLKIMLIH